jgi:DNA-binding HxlR family transcriptional regulator
MKLAERKSRPEVSLPASRKPKSHCPIHFALNVFGDAWTLLIVRDLMFKGKSSYRDFLDGGEGISTNILADRLARLESDGIITRDVIHTADARTHYRLTDKGLDLMPLLLEMIAWSAKYDRKTAATEDFVHRVRRDRDALVKELRSGFAR